jgi:type IX secretion system PorP/SprF family membrane protein
MKRILLLTISLSLLVIPAIGQVQLTQYFLDGTLYNPAFVGSQEAICVNSFGRQQWVGFSDAENNYVSPLTGVINFNAPVYSMNSGFGVNVVYDQAGFEQNVMAKLNYAYRIPFKNERKSLGIGIGVSILNKAVDFTRIILEQPGDPLLIINQKERGSFTDVDFGIHYQDINKFYIGVSGTNLLALPTEIGNVKFGRQRTLYLTSGYYIKLSESRRKAMYLIPSVLIKSDLVNVQCDISARIEYNKQYWAGVSYRYQDAVAVMVGINLDGFRIGASYDVITSYISKSSYGSAEIFVGYCIPTTPKVKLNNLYNTRYL